VKASASEPVAVVPAQLALAVGDFLWGILCADRAPRPREFIVNDELANDRTFLAWLRTSIACFGFGFVVAKWALIINTKGGSLQGKTWYTATGIAIVLSGAALVMAGYRQYRRVLDGLRPSATAPDQPRWPLMMTAVAVLGALALSALIALAR
jgi:putative membrane protein